ncbi:MAG: hypothetical protein ACRELG_11070 [Gemmataceae bacterium]
MELRLDHLLHMLREDPTAILEAIDRDPLLLKRESGQLVLANASQALYTPQQEHQLFAKGIVYRRCPHRVVSLPLVKIYNLGEHDVTVTDLAALIEEPHVRPRFLRKIDGSLIQVFHHDGRVWFTTRGMIEGARPRSGRDNGEDRSDFDYLGTARRLAADRYPRLLDAAARLDGRTLIFELIHPLAKKVTNYGERIDLILLGCFDSRRLSYAPYSEVAVLAETHGLTVVEALSPRGATLSEQIEHLLAALAGTDQEGGVLQIENAQEVIYRVKVKSPDYLRLLRAMAECTYENLVALMDDNPHLTSWQEVEAFLKGRGREAVPEEVLSLYRPHYERFTAYLGDCERLRQWATRVYDQIDRQLSGRHDKDAATYRKNYAALATRYRHAALLFAALDGRLDRIRRLIRDAEQARQALRDLE